MYAVFTCYTCSFNTDGKCVIIYDGRTHFQATEYEYECDRLVSFVKIYSHMRFGDRTAHSELLSM